MKKSVTLCMAGLLAISLCCPPVYADAETGGIAGVWKLVQMESAGETVGSEEIEQMEQLGETMYMDVSADGSLIISYFGEETEGLWDEESITVAGDPASYTLDGDYLSVSEGDTIMTFERTTIETIYSILGYKEGVLDETVSYAGDEQEILSTDDVSVAITGYSAGMDGFRVKIRCDSHSENALMISADHCFINRYHQEPSWGVRIEAGESDESEMVFPVPDLEKCGISAVDELILSLQVADADNWEVLDEGEAVYVYPTGKAAGDITAAGRQPVENEMICTDNDACTFVVQGTEFNSNLGYMVDSYFENKTDQPLTFLWEKTSVNGEEVLSFFAEETYPGTKGYGQALFLTGSLEEKGIQPENISEIQFTLKVYDTTEEVPQTVFEEQFTYQP